jgi:hypothetical protein
LLRRFSLWIALLALTTTAGCKSPYVNATVRNETGAPVTLIEVDYPSAGFGRESLAAGAAFPYRFKILGNGPTKVSWTDASRKEHSSAGPELHEGQQGQLTIMLNPTGADWTQHLTP